MRVLILLLYKIQYLELMRGKYQIPLATFTHSRLSEKEICAAYTEKVSRLCNGITFAKKEHGGIVTYFWASRKDLPKDEELDHLRAEGYTIIPYRL